MTSVGRGRSEQLHDRTKRYLITMGIRTVCFALAIVVTITWLRWTFAALAVVLPYLAVVAANAGGDRRAAPGTQVDQPALPGPHPAPAAEYTSAEQVRPDAPAETGPDDVRSPGDGPIRRESDNSGPGGHDG
ncbi:DUF3099 domain-containing protein [Ruania sp. N2-46]|uniref:DUF3099 domain-containing protein n=1 Tax=Occultella gossypii TaxID=2800820 RepID=A0ABS7S2I5_9MICO|nr:DUF3099 domain-containing protein [Occultella gossypii]